MWKINVRGHYVIRSQLACCKFGEIGPRMMKEQHIGFCQFFFPPKAKKMLTRTWGRGRQRMWLKQNDGWRKDWGRYKMMGNYMEKERQSLSWCDSIRKEECVLLISEGSAGPRDLYRGTAQRLFDTLPREDERNSRLWPLLPGNRS